MRFKLWVENEQILNIPINKIWGWRPKTDEVFDDIQQGRFSHSFGSPVVVSRLDNPRGNFFIIDGYHRIVESALNGQTNIQAKIDAYVPRIERTGGSHSAMLAEKIPITELIQRILSLRNFKS